MKDTEDFNTQGRWYLQAEVIDNAENPNYVTSGLYLVDKTPPSNSVSGQNVESGEPITVIVSSSDTGGSGVRLNRYAWSTSTDKPTSWETVYSENFSVTLAEAGIYYLHVETVDNAGNTTWNVYGTYRYYRVRITNVTIDGYWNHWRGQVDKLGKQLTVEPHRFLSLETVKINVYTEGHADKVVIRFSPELEAMQFIDKRGNLYDYNKDFFGYYVKFPEDSTFILDSSLNNNHVYWEYTLPLALSSKSWDDVRLREPYTMTVTAYSGSYSVTYVIDDIDITGNIYDLIEIQPHR